MSSSSEEEESEEEVFTQGKPMYASKMPAGYVPSKRPAPLKSLPSKRPKYQHESEESEESDEQEVEEKQERTRGSYFVDDIADVDDEEDEEDEEEDGFEQVAEAPAAVDVEKPRKRPAFAMGGGDDEHEMLKKAAERYEARYENESAYDEYEEPTSTSAKGVGAKDLIPGIKDPKLWMLRCKPGKERNIITSLMSAFYKKLSTGDEEMFIMSAFTTDTSPGYIYVEADKEIHVKKAIENVRFLNTYKISLVPIKEMIPALTVRLVTTSIKRGQWVRVKRGLYKDDVAQVITVRDQSTQVTVRLVPRLDSKKMASSISKGSARAAQELFNAKSFEDNVSTEVEPVTRWKCDLYGSNFYKRGFLIKTFKADALVTSGVAPTVLELELFQNKMAGIASDDESDEKVFSELDSVVSSGAMQGKAVYARGDSIRVIRGDLKHLTGVILAVFGDKVKVKPNHSELTESIEFSVNDIRKYFRLGDHVKIVRGEFSGETGLIVRVEESEDLVIVVSDISNREMKVLSKDIIESVEVTTGAETLGNYELYDLVTVGRDIVGVITRVETNSFRIMDTKEVIHRIRLQEVGRKRNSRFAVAIDAKDQQIQRDDIVKVIGGQHKGKQGTIKHIYRSFIFLWSREVSDNSGVFVVRARDCSILGQTTASKASAAAAQKGRLGAPSAGGVKSRLPQRDPWIGETVVVKVGTYKSLMGIVKDSSETNFRVELISRGKVVSVPRSGVKKLDGTTASTRPEDVYSMNGGVTPGDSLIGGRTPGFDPSKTPHLGSTTPMSGSNAWGRTPSSSNDAWGSTSTPYSVPTPGNFTTPHHPHTPNPATPHTPFTPGASSRYSQAPYSANPYTPITPGGVMHTPHTPHLETPHHPATPGHGPITPRFDDQSSYGGSAAAEHFDWALAGVCVSIPKTQKEGVILEVSDHQIKVRIKGEGITDMFAFSEVQPVSISRNDEVIVVSGPNRGDTGTLIGLDGGDGIVNTGSDIGIFEISVLAKYDKSVV
jgi:transcription elongation factor SPT5